MEYVANTPIFVLSGVIIAAKIYVNSVGEANDIVPIDYGYAVLLWVYLLVRVSAHNSHPPSFPLELGAILVLCLPAGLWGRPGSTTPLEFNRS